MRSCPLLKTLAKGMVIKVQRSSLSKSPVITQICCYRKLILCLGLMSIFAIANEPDEEISDMSVMGTFEVQLEPQKDERAPVGRMLITKKYTGGLVGSGIGQMISKRTENGVAVYSAIEEFEGSLNGKEGAFTLIHQGYMSSTSQSLDVQILEGSGAGELQGISGELFIIPKEGGHDYELKYTL